MNRSRSRELTFKFLYGAEIQKELDETQIEEFLIQNDIADENATEYLKDAVFGIKKYSQEITNAISKNLKDNWEIERISKVNLALLKLSIYEIQYKNLPYKAIINEVVELAKRYGDETSSAFINGVLASIVKQMQEGESK